MNDKLVSIITPAYRCKDTILGTYESIKSQTYQEWEWLIVEDNSSDGTYDFIYELVGKDDRVRLLRTEKNSGAAVARNVGISNARGRYIAFLDADDLWKKDKLLHQLKFMNENDFVFTFTNYDLVYSSGKTKTYRIKTDKTNYKKTLRSNKIGCLTAIYDAKILGKVFMPLDCEKREDHGAWLDILRTGNLAYRLDESLAIYRVGSGSVSSNKLRMMKFQYRLYRRHEKFSAIKSMFYTLICSINRLAKKY